MLNSIPFGKLSKPFLASKHSAPSEIQFRFCTFFIWINIVPNKKSYKIFILFQQLCSIPKVKNHHLKKLRTQAFSKFPIKDMSAQQNYSSVDVSDAKGQNYRLITPTTSFSKTAFLFVLLLTEDDLYNRSMSTFSFVLTKCIHLTYLNNFGISICHLDASLLQPFKPVLTPSCNFSCISALSLVWPSRELVWEAKKITCTISFWGVQFLEPEHHRVGKHQSCHQERGGKRPEFWLH